MAAQKGLEMLLKVDTTGAGAFSTIAGIQSTGLTINNEQVDITSQDNTDRWRELLAGTGVKNMTLSGSGVFKDGADAATVNTYALNDTQNDWNILVPDFGTYQGAFQVSSLEFTGEHNGEVQFSISLESAGTITFTAA